MILAGDIGGTKSLVALFERTDTGPRLIRDGTFKSQSYASLDAVLSAFLDAHDTSRLQVACFGVPGAVIDGRCAVTNLPWVLEEEALATRLRVPRVKLLNDLEAAAYGMLHLAPDAFAVLNRGAQPKRRGNVAVIAAGTGLGEAILFWDGRVHHPSATEGGHVSFAPCTDQEIELLRYLREKLEGHVSVERVLAGPGLENLYRFLRDSGYAEEPAWLAQRLQSGDAAATITQLGLAGEQRLCVAALELFASIYGAEAGNLALKCLAVGGVFVGGGIAPKILPVLQRGGFMQAFTDKGRFADLLRSLEVRVALNPRAPLLGAAYYAQRLAS